MRPQEVTVGMAVLFDGVAGSVMKRDGARVRVDFGERKRWLKVEELEPAEAAANAAEPKLEPEPQPEPVTAEAEPEQETAPEQETEPEPEPETEPQTVPEPEPQAESQPEPEPEPERARQQETDATDMTDSKWVKVTHDGRALFINRGSKRVPPSLDGPGDGAVKKELDIATAKMAPEKFDKIYQALMKKRDGKTQGAIVAGPCADGLRLFTVLVPIVR